MTGLTEQERDSLTECECGHFANEHSSDGCLATDFSEADDRPVRDDDVCPCTHSPSAITRHAVEAIKAAARAEVARDMRTKIETMADDHSLWAQHRPVVGKFAGMFAAVGCSCMDRVFVAGAESYAQHIAALLADGGEPQ